jgi:hypothetical protein
MPVQKLPAEMIGCPLFAERLCDFPMEWKKPVDFSNYSISRQAPGITRTQQKEPAIIENEPALKVNHLVKHENDA